MNYLVHNAVRAVHNRTSRARAATHRGMKQFMFKGQLRLVRGRPLPLTEEGLMANLEEIQQKVRSGMIFVTLGDLTPFDVETLTPVKASPKVKQPDFPQDSINRDKPAGLAVSKYGDKPPPATFEMPVDPPDAAVSNPVVKEEPAPVEEEEAELEEEESVDKSTKSGDAPSKKRRRR